jgi:uncharacterized RDD family membrane protein YckC
LKIRTGQGVEIDLELAGLGARSYAFLIDWHIRILLAAAWVIAAVGLVWLLRQGADDVLEWIGERRLMTWVLLPAGLIYLLYHPLFEIATSGRTPGKRLAGIRVIGDDGRVPGVGAHLARNVFRLIDSLPLLYVLGIVVGLCNRRQLRIGDLAAGTVLIYEQAPSWVRLEAIIAGAAGDSPEGAEIARELDARWSVLGAVARREIALALLARLRPQASAATLTDAALRAMVRELGAAPAS